MPKHNPLVRLESPQGPAVGVRPRDVVGVYPAGKYDPERPITSINLSAKSWVLVLGTPEQVMEKLEAAERVDPEGYRTQIAQLQEKLQEVRERLAKASEVVEAVREWQGADLESEIVSRQGSRVLAMQLPPKEVG